MAKRREWGKLVISIVIDTIGMSTVVFGVTELVDLVWAPVQAFALQLMYGNLWYTSIGFVEEILPMTDIIPTATLAWLNEEFNIIKL